MIKINLLVNNIGEILKKARIEKNIILKEASSISGLSSAYISRIENASSTPSFDALMKLCNLYSLNINDYAENIDIEENQKYDIRNLLLNGEIFYKNKELKMKDKLNLLRFVELITSFEDDNYQNICESSLEYLSEIKRNMEEIKNNDR